VLCSFFVYLKIINNVLIYYLFNIVLKKRLFVFYLKNRRKITKWSLLCRMWKIHLPFSNNLWYRTASKERRVSTITETLKKKNFYINRSVKRIGLLYDFKYIIFIKFSVIHQKLRGWKNLLYFQKRCKTRHKIKGILMKITLSNSV